jgi:hypothetical protein
MRKLLFLILFVPAMVFAAVWELDKGAVELGGTAEFVSMSGDAYETADGDGITRFGINPEIGYFVIPNLEFGLMLEYASETQGDAKLNSFGLGPFAGYYFLDESSTVNPYLGAAFIFGSTTWDLGSGDSTTTTTAFMFMGGALYRLVDHYGIRTAVFYRMDSFDNSDWDESLSGGIFGIQIGFSGFIY